MTVIVHRIDSSKQKVWQTSLINSITNAKSLFERLELDPIYLPQAEKASQIFPLRVTEHYLQQIEKGNINDPLLKQILPLQIELDDIKGFTADPLQEKRFNPLPGLLHKYESRILLTITQACAIHCRYCFRREFNYNENNPGRKAWQTIIDYIKQHPKVNEVIYSGGDPLMASDDYLAELTDKLAKLPQLTRLRIHSRLPVLIPERINGALLDWLMSSPKMLKIFILHCNHPNEISKDVIESLQRLKQAGVLLLNQSVLLKGINDDSQTLVKLSEELFKAGVQPYYLHLLDRVKGTAHFEVDEKHAKQIMREVTAKLPGYLVPKLAREEAGSVAKTVLA